VGNAWKLPTMLKNNIQKRETRYHDKIKQKYFVLIGKPQ
jgi:hypothetical protein